MPDYSADFNGSTVVVTGATSGIGREIALRFADAGATVLNADIDAQPKDAETPTHELIRERGGTAEYVQTDVSNAAEIREAVDRAREYGGVDVMVNNAGLFIGGGLLEVSEDEFEKIHDVNAKGVFFGCQAAAQDMIDRGVEGAIINTASISSFVAQREQIQYDSTKAAVKMITRGAALELAEHDIRVNAVGPGQIATEFIDGWSEEAPAAAESDELIKPVPLGRAGTPDDIAGAVLYLASDDAAYVTGEVLMVDGGWRTI
ncbi:MULTISPECIES: SDR family NAD(P)-dependent oxidoreductase [Haloferax]|uniref:Glucose 1-dehydrogenase n=2 Tax=Haloferax TaxID=2251 RepID=A0A6G1Z6D3_9EURY|nr:MULTISPECIES: SDR family oxidoreductase [Haloferax]KAB1185341.1 SDR family oxidoreductase [Haloferax sp. CBA1149]MRW81978.1 glucose 1-dehydrogenase [Haloferax marinisediminis]